MNAFARAVTACMFLTACIPLMGQTIHGQADAPISGTVAGTDIHSRDADELRYYIVKELTDRFAEERNIAATQADVDAYVQHVQTALLKDRMEREARRDDLSRKLRDESISESAHKSMAEELEMLNESIESLSGLGADATESPEDRAARRQIAEAFVRQWKINRALYQEYRGRIAFQQGGPEPLDAYRWFLEAKQASGEFVISNKDMEAAFWSYFRNDAIHDFYPPGSLEEAQAFADPPWLPR